MAWEFEANDRAEIGGIRKTWPNPKSATVADELFQFFHLLEALAETDILEYPLRATHTGESGVPDLRLKLREREIAIEVAKVTTPNLEHARALQAKFAEAPPPPRRFERRDVHIPGELARRLKYGTEPWSFLLRSHLESKVRDWIEKWDWKAEVPPEVVEGFVRALNAIVDGPAIAHLSELQGACPPPYLIIIDGLCDEETSEDRKGWLEEAFYDCLSRPINPTLMVNRFVKPKWMDWQFCVEDLKNNGTLLAFRLTRRADRVSKFIWEGLDAPTREGLKALQEQSSPSDGLRQEVVGKLNGLVSGGPIWTEDRFHGVDLRAKTRTLLAANPTGGKLHELNRLLLEDAYPLELSRCRSRKREIVETGFLVSAQDFGPDISQEREIWMERVLEEISDKSRTHAGGDFQHGSEDWLLLWDRLGTPDWDLWHRASALSHRLGKQWRDKWFTRIFIQDEYFEWQIMLTPVGVSRLPAASP